LPIIQRQARAKLVMRELALTIVLQVGIAVIALESKVLRVFWP